jgi:hypothetical protein
MLITTLNLPRPDETYAQLIAAHDGLDMGQSQALNARLVLILMNHIGDPSVLTEAIARARSPAEARQPA